MNKYTFALTLSSTLSLHVISNYDNKPKNSISICDYVGETFLDSASGVWPSQTDAFFSPCMSTDKSVPDVILKVQQAIMTCTI